MNLRTQIDAELSTRRNEAIKSMREEGWRIVRLEHAAVFDHPDHVTVRYEDEDHEGWRDLWIITEEL